MAALLKEWLVDDLKVQSDCSDLATVSYDTCPVKIFLHATVCGYLSYAVCRIWQADTSSARSWPRATCSQISVSLLTVQLLLLCSTTTYACRQVLYELICSEKIQGYLQHVLGMLSSDGDITNCSQPCKSLASR